MHWVVVVALIFAGIVWQNGWTMALSYLGLGLGMCFSAWCLRMAYDIWAVGR